MTQDEIIEMARQAQSVYGTDTWTFALCANQLEAFAKLIAAKEREACAKLAFQYGYGLDDDDAQIAAVEISDAIRAKSGDTK